VGLLHHAGKGGHEYRGSTAIGDAVELGFTLSRHEDDREKRTRRKLACWKSRPAPEPEERWISMGSHDGLITLSEAEAYKPEREKPREQHRDDVLETLGDEPLGERRIAERTGIARTTVQRILRDLEDEGLSEQTGSGWVAHRPMADRGRAMWATPQDGSETGSSKPNQGGPLGGPACSCADTPGTTPDGRCSRCWGWPR
jgi:hypothetical protein